MDDVDHILGMLDLVSPPKAKPVGPWPYPLPPKPPVVHTIEEWRATFAPEPKRRKDLWLATGYFGACLIVLVVCSLILRAG